MTIDYEKMKALFDDLGVGYEEEEFAHLLVHYTSPCADGLRYNQHIKLEGGAGYYGFYTEFYFFDGKYLTHGCWE